MTETIFASQNGRIIPKEDKIFGISNRAKARAAAEGKENVVNATIGALLNDDGNLIVLSSVDKVFRSLSTVEFAEYAPIGGTAGFKEAVKKDVFRRFIPTVFTETVSTPGGTGAIRNTISNYSEHGDTVLTADWYWSPYGTIAQEQGRKLDSFQLFDETGAFNKADFEKKVRELLEKQERLVIIINTPSHNPTGYALTDREWKDVAEILDGASKDKKITLMVDAAYIDFAGDEDESRSFFPILETMPDNVLVVIAHSLSKAYTLYGLRCGAMICMTKSKDIAEEFKRVCEFSSRASWSNCSKAPQVMLTKIYDDPELLKNVMDERKIYRDMLIKRGRTFKAAADEAGLRILPFRSGFFMSIPCETPDKVAARLEEEGIFVVPLAKGIRVSGASTPEKDCGRIPAAIKKAMDAE